MLTADHTALARIISEAHGPPRTFGSGGSRRLWLAVMELAILDGRKPTPHGAEARAYLSAARTDYLGGFGQICEELDLQPSTVRAYAFARYGQQPIAGPTHAVVLAGRASPHRRTLSAVVTRSCVTCGEPFSTPWRQRHACSTKCARQARRKKRGA